ncbi:MAG: DUF4854 domain-containing protein [Lachnospiraceae bacterium]|nr:DUF4854 domain-containing protein [Lachnospiraceae bacterium]MBQ5385886.1 DUF4854 domain-containing protein [Lachnospiraceae bacterium]
MKRFLTTVATAMTAMMLLVGCGGPANLEEALQKDEEAKAQIEQMSSESGVSIEVKENTISYTYDLGMELDDETKDAVVEQLNTQISAYDDTFTGIAKSVEDSTKLSGILVVVNYSDSQGNVIYSATYNAEGRVDNE